MGPHPFHIPEGMDMLRSKSRLDELRDTINEQSLEILKLQQTIFKMADDNAAIEQGREEMEEGYQQMLLDHQQVIQGLLDKNAELLDKVRQHDENCLVDLGINYTPLDEDVSTTERQDHVEQPDHRDHRPG